MSKARKALHRRTYYYFQAAESDPAGTACSVSDNGVALNETTTNPLKVTCPACKRIQKAQGKDTMVERKR